MDPHKGTYTGRAAIVVRVKNAAGQLTQKLSQQYLLSGDARDVEAARQGDIIFYREVDLDPGIYTIESIVFDAGAQRGSARVTTLVGSAGRRSRRRDEQPGARQPHRRNRRCACAAGRVTSTALRRPHAALSESGRDRSASLRSASCRSTSRCTGTSAPPASARSCCATGRLLAEAPVTLPASTDGPRPARRPPADFRTPRRHLRAPDRAQERRARAIANGVFHADRIAAADELDIAGVAAMPSLAGSVLCCSAWPNFAACCPSDLTRIRRTDPFPTSSVSTISWR